jgi:hypothetical protein
VNNVDLEVDAASPAPANASWITLPPALGPVAAGAPRLKNLREELLRPLAQPGGKTAGVVLNEL